jgi:hypothetical protein
LCSLINSQNTTLLFQAILDRRLELVRELLKLPFDINGDMEIISDDERGSYELVNLIDYAWGNRDHDIVLELLKANSNYPKDFKASKTTDEVMEFVKISIDMHEAIRQNDQERVAEILDKNEDLRYFFDSHNLSAANLALKNRNTAIYRLLVEHNVTFGPNENISNDHSYDFNDSICDLNSELAEHLPEHHIMILLSRSVIPRGDPQHSQRLQAIRKAFMIINQIPQVRQLLQIIATSRKTKIHFDFTHASVIYMDPTVGAGTDGLFNAGNHHLHIAARNLLEDGTNITHTERCHTNLDMAACFWSLGTTNCRMLSMTR